MYVDELGEYRSNGHHSGSGITKAGGCYDDR